MSSTKWKEGIRTMEKGITFETATNHKGEFTKVNYNGETIFVTDCDGFVSLAVVSVYYEDYSPDAQRLLRNMGIAQEYGLWSYRGFDEYKIVRTEFLSSEWNCMEDLKVALMQKISKATALMSS